MLAEEVTEAWKKLRVNERRSIWSTDPVLSFFQAEFIQDCLEGKSQGFNMEQIIEVQDKLAAAPKPSDKVIRDVFSTSKSKVARSHKFNRIIEDRLTALR